MYRITNADRPNEEIMYGKAARPRRYYFRVGLSKSVILLNTHRYTILREINNIT